MDIFNNFGKRINVGRISHHTKTTVRNALQTVTESVVTSNNDI